MTAKDFLEAVKQVITDETGHLQPWVKTPDGKKYMVITVDNAYGRVSIRTGPNVSEIQEAPGVSEDCPSGEATCEMGKGNYGLCRTHPTCEAVQKLISDLKAQVVAPGMVSREAVLTCIAANLSRPQDIYAAVAALPTGTETEK